MATLREIEQRCVLYSPPSADCANVTVWRIKADGRLKSVRNIEKITKVGFGADLCREMSGRRGTVERGIQMRKWIAELCWLGFDRTAMRMRWTTRRCLRRLDMGVQIGRR